MNSFFVVVLVGISLSMDAFSLSLLYGTNGINQKSQLFLSFIVGIFHFFMPILGLRLGNILISNISFNLNYIVGIIFSIIGVEMIISSIRDKKAEIIDSLIGYLMFGFSVSIDSFTTGIGLNIIYNNYYIVAFVFMVCSFLFTYMGLKLGNVLNIKFGNISNLVGAIILIILGFVYFFK